MDSTDEPSKWVCHLIGHFDSGESPIHGTGFLVNIPDTNMYCIMTAGHNLKRAEGGYAISIQVIFPNQLKFTAEPGEFFVSKIYHDYTTLKETDESSVSDYGLITVERNKVMAPKELDLRGCAFSILTPKSELLGMDCTVHGYKLGDPLQTKNTSKFLIVLPETFSYIKETTPGVSGGPIFISQHGSDIAVGIHNYNQRATRLTYRVILEMLSWIKDYGLLRTIKVFGASEIYLRSTRGSNPNIIVRRGQDEYSNFNFVVVSAAKNEAALSHHRFAITPAHCRPKTENTFYFLTINKDGDEGGEARAILREDTSPGKESILALHRRGKTEGFRLTSASKSAASLAVKPRESRRHSCECGCITQDDAVQFHPTVNTAFSLLPKMKDFSPKKRR